MCLCVKQSFWTSLDSGYCFWFRSTINTVSVHCFLYFLHLCEFEDNILVAATTSKKEALPLLLAECVEEIDDVLGHSSELRSWICYLWQHLKADSTYCGCKLSLLTIWKRLHLELGIWRNDSGNSKRSKDVCRLPRCTPLLLVSIKSSCSTCLHAAEAVSGGYPSLIPFSLIPNQNRVVGFFSLSFQCLGC